jgi:hypothetical protein
MHMDIASEAPFSTNKAVFSFHPKIFHPITSNIWTYAWSTKCRQKKLIAQFGWKPRDESFKPN